MKKYLVKIPFLGPLGRRVGQELRAWSRALRNKRPKHFEFSRIDFDSPSAKHQYPAPEVVRVVNLLNYTKTSQSAYSGEKFPAGYHTIELPGLNLPGQRDPKERIRLIPFDFAGKTVLDIGCNQGGMLFALPSEIRHGVGIDYDHRLVNAANKVRSHSKIPNLDFYVFNLEKEDLNLIRDFLPAEKMDVAFLLAVCMWIENWRDVVRFASKVCDAMLFEANGKPEQQQEQVDFLKAIYTNVQLLQEQSLDDPLQKKRKLYWCR
jgi:2-polyprenyl-3-methyl-5-hydroxy-6-metoxy-1,4-benzoquinol methylase